MTDENTTFEVDVRSTETIVVQAPTVMAAEAAAERRANGHDSEVVGSNSVRGQ